MVNMLDPKITKTFELAPVFFLDLSSSFTDQYNVNESNHLYKPKSKQNLHHWPVTPKCSFFQKRQFTLTFPNTIAFVIISQQFHIHTLTYCTQSDPSHCFIHHCVTVANLLGPKPPPPRFRKLISTCGLWSNQKECR